MLLTALLPYLPYVAAVWATFVFGVGLGVIIRDLNTPKGGNVGSVA